MSKPQAPMPDSSVPDSTIDKIPVFSLVAKIAPAIGIGCLLTDNKLGALGFFFLTAAELTANMMRRDLRQQALTGAIPEWSRGGIGGLTALYTFAYGALAVDMTSHKFFFGPDLFGKGMALKFAFDIAATAAMAGWTMWMTLKDKPQPIRPALPDYLMRAEASMRTTHDSSQP